MIQANTAPFFRQQFFNSSGKPLTGGRIEFYSAGSATPKSVFADRNMTTNLGNVLQFDDAGCPVHYFMASGEYDIKIYDQFNVLVDNPLRIDASGGPSSPFPDPANPGFLHWDGSVYAWIPVQMYPIPGNSGYLHYDVDTQTYSWTEITPDDHKVSNSDTDIPGYLKDKIVNSPTINWSEIIVDGNSVLKADTVQLDKVPAVVVWAVLSPTDSATAPFGLSNDDVNRMIDTGFGVAAQMEQTTFQSDLSIWYATGTYWGDAVWEEKKFPLGSCITNLDHGNWGYLHTHPEFRPTTDASNFPAGIYTIVMQGDGYYWNSLIVEQFPDPSYNITSFLKYDATNKAFVWLDASLLTAKPIGPAGGDLYGTYPDPIVRQLTGVGTSLVNMDVQGKGHASGPGISGFTYGRGCVPGFIYKGGNHVAAWIAQSSNGDMYISTDHFQKATKDTSLSANSNYTDTANWGYGAQCIYYGKKAKTDNYKCWIVFKQSFSGFFYAVDVVGNYNTDGTLKQSAWVKVANSNVMDSVAHAVQTKDGGVLLTAAYMEGVTYYSDLASTGSKFNAYEEISGIATDSYGTYMVVGRNSGKLYKNTSETTSTFDNTAWTVFNSAGGFTIDGAPANNLPITGSGGGLDQTWWAGMGCAYGLWVVTVALKHLSTDPIYAYSDNGLDWITYGGPNDAVITTWDMKTDGVYWFGCPTNQPTPLVYQILVNSIPAHKRLICEKGLLVSGDTFLADLPNAPSLGTDENGKIIAGEGAVAQIGDAPKVDYVFSPYDGGTRKWIPNGKASGVVENVLGALVRDNVNHTITVPAYTVQLFDNNNFLGQPLRYQVASSTHTISNVNVRSFVTAKYIAPGVVQTVLTPFVDDLNMSSQCPLFAVERTTYTDGTDTIHVIEYDTQGEGLAQKTSVMLTRTEPYRRSKEGGLLISSTNRHIQLTSSLVYAATVPTNVLAFDSALTGHLLTHAYKVAGVWTYMAETSGQFNNTHYQGTTDIIELGNNKWKNVWIYRSIGDDKETIYVDGPAEYNTSDEALLENTEPSIPSLVDWHCMLVGRVTIQKSTSTGYITKSAFIDAFSGTSSGGGDFIRNQASNGTNDAPGNIFLDPAATINIRYEDTGTPANNVNWFSVSKDMLKLQGLDVNNPALIGYQAELTPSALALRGRPGTSYGIYNAAVIMSREQFAWVPNVNGAWYTFFHQDLGGGTAQAQGGYSFPRLKMRIGATDTVSAELEHKIVNSSGAEFAQITNGTYGKAIVIPTAVLAGTPNSEQLFSYSIAEGDPHTIAQDGSDSGNCSGNRGFAFVANGSRLMTRAKMMFTQSAGTYRIGIYNASAQLLGKTPNTPVAPGMTWVNFESPIQLVGGELYYMAYYLSDTTGNVRFPCIAGRSIYGAEPLPQRYDQNNEMPNTLGTSGSPTGYRPWIIVSE